MESKPEEQIGIRQVDKSGASTAQVLEDKVSDSSGNCTWSWKVGTRTTPGDWRIIITVQGIGQIEQYFTVTG